MAPTKRIAMMDKNTTGLFNTLNSTPLYHKLTLFIIRSILFGAFCSSFGVVFMMSRASNGIKVKARNQELSRVRLTTQNRGDEISPIGVSASAKGKKADAVVSVEISKGIINILLE